MINRKIYVVCPDRNNPLGGVKQLYRLVDNLNALGHEAYILHKKKNFRVTWYNNQTPISSFAGVFKKLNWHRKSTFMKFIEGIIFGKKMPEIGSIIVFPEVYGPYINQFNEYEIVIFNQNCYYTFEKFPAFKTTISPYTNTNLIGCLVVSEDSKQYLSLYYPNLNIQRIRIGLSDIFKYKKEKKKKIAYMPRKLAEDANQIYQYFAQKQYFKDWEFVGIDGLSEQEVSNVLSECAIFLSLNYREGFGLPPAEAMACGCYVIGYAGNAGKEYFKSEFSIKIEDRNIIAFVLALEKTIIEYNQNPNQIIARGELASAYITNIYNKANEITDIATSWNNFFHQK